MDFFFQCTFKCFLWLGLGREMREQEMSGFWFCCLEGVNFGKNFKRGN